MKKNVFYSIEKSQLIVLWIFGLLSFVFTLEPALDYGSSTAIFLMLFIPFLLIFYTLGWKKQNKESSKEIADVIIQQKHKGQNFIQGTFSFIKKRKIILIVLLIVIILGLNNLFSEKQEVDNLKTQVPIEIETCKGNIKDLAIIESKYSTYDLMNYDPLIGNDKNTIKVYGLIKNNSNCSLSKVDLKFTLQSSTNLDIKQEEIIEVTYFFDFIMSQKTGEYTKSFRVFDALLSKQSPDGFVESSKLRNDVKIKTEVVSAEWLN